MSELVGTLWASRLRECKPDSLAEFFEAFWFAHGLSSQATCKQEFPKLAHALELGDFLSMNEQPLINRRRIRES
jgi:hypothetical protein